MKKMNSILAFMICLVCSMAGAQADQPITKVLDAEAHRTAPEHPAKTGCLDAHLEKNAMQILFKLGQEVIVSAADAMPADKFGFAPTDGEFKGTRTFGQQVKHLAATNYILSAAALGEGPPADAGDEMGPETVRTKAEILEYLRGSFRRLGKAIDAVGDANVPVVASPISPLKGAFVTRIALITESLVHAFDHYGQMVEYLRMNGVVPPASRP